MNRFCMMCGKPLVPGTLYCGECGAKVTVPSPASLPVAPLTQEAVQAPSPSLSIPNGVEPSARPSKVVTWLKVVVVLLLILDGLLNPNVAEALRKKAQAEASTADVVKSFFVFE